MKTIANHSEPLKLDLQFFADEDNFFDEDMIMPDETVETDIPESDDAFESDIETEEVPEDTGEVEPPAEETPEPQKFKVKFNKEEQEITYDDAVPLIQKGMNFEKSVERARQEARDALIQEYGYEWNGKPITTEAEYKQALQEKEWMEKYQSQDLPDDVIQELIEGKKFREQFKSQQDEQTQLQAKQERESQDFKDFYDYFTQVNGRSFDANKDILPKEVFEMNAQGVPLKFAYMEHQNQQLQSQLQVLKQNQTNKQKAPVTSVTSHGSTEVASEDPFEMGFDSI